MCRAAPTLFFPVCLLFSRLTQTNETVDKGQAKPCEAGLRGQRAPCEAGGGRHLSGGGNESRLLPWVINQEFVKT